MVLSVKQTEFGEELILDSSNIDKTIYDKEIETLIIWFKKGGSYIYSPIDVNMYNDFKYTDSQGRFFSHYIKNNENILCEKVYANNKNDQTL